MLHVGVNGLINWLIINWLINNPWRFERVALYTSYSSRESAELPNSFIFNLSCLIFTSLGTGGEASYYI